MSSSDKKSAFTLSIKDYPKLTGKADYLTWAKAWQWAFKSAKLWTLVDGSRKKPVLRSEGQSSDTEVKSAGEWEEENTNTMFLLIQGVSSTLQQDIVAYETAAEAWQALKDRFDKETPNTDIISLKNVLLNDFQIGQNIVYHTTNFENAWNRLATRSKQATDKKTSFLYITKLMCESEEFKGAVYLASLMDTHRDLCDTLAAREQRDYVDVRDFFLSRAAEKSETGEGDKALSAQNRKEYKKRECTWCKARSFKYDNHITSKCHKLKREKEKKGKQHAASTATETFTILATTNQQSEPITSTWLCDSGASSHISPNSGDFLNLTHSDAKIVTADGRTHNATAYGDARLRVRLPNGTSHTVVLTRTLYVPSFQFSLVSESRLDDVGVEITVGKGKRKYEKNGKEFMMARKERGLWKVVIAQEQALSVSYGSTYEEKHESLGHPSVIRDVYKDSPPIPVLKDFNCDTCNKQKSQHSSPPTIGIRTEHPFDKVHSDLSGRFNIPTLGKNEYYMTFVDDYTRYCWIYLLKSKDQASIAISNFWQFTKTQFSKTIKRLHSDNGTEYVNQNVSLFLQKNGTIHTTSPPHHPELNSVAERINQTLTTIVRCILPEDKKFLWGEAYSTAGYLYNRRWHSTIESTPYQQLYGAKPSISHLGSWFTHALVHIPSDKRGKLDQPVEEGFLVGYTSNPTVFRIYIPKRHTITKSKDVKFDRIRGVSLKYHYEPSIQQQEPTPTQSAPKQNEIPGAFPPEPERQSSKPVKITEKAAQQLQVEKDKMQRSITNIYKKMSTEVDKFNENMKTLTDPKGIEHGKQQQVMSRQRHQEKIRDLQARIDRKEFAGLTYHIPDPNTYQQAMESDESEDWKRAMDEEMEVLCNGIYYYRYYSLP